MLSFDRRHCRQQLLARRTVFERKAAVITDIGIDPDVLGEPWREAVSSLDAVLRESPATDPLLATLAALGEALASALPRREDDVDELPNAMSAG